MLYNPYFFTLFGLGEYCFYAKNKKSSQIVCRFKYNLYICSVNSKN